MRLRALPDGNAIRAYSEKHQCGFYTAKRDLLAQWRQASLEDLLNQARLGCPTKDILVTLLELLTTDNLGKE